MRVITVTPGRNQPAGAVFSVAMREVTIVAVG
jgi:hypothetical protein